MPGRSSLLARLMAVSVNQGAPGLVGLAAPPAPVFAVFPALSDVSWTNVGTPVRTTGVADPFGGTAAETIEDDAAGAIEGISRLSTFVLVSGERYVITHYVAKDAVATRFPEFQHSQTGSANVQLNTQTGQTAIRSSSGWTNVAWSAITAPENALWWKCVLGFTANAPGAVTLNVHPASAASLGGAPAVATLGAIGYFPGQIRQTS